MKSLKAIVLAVVFLILGVSAWAAGSCTMEIVALGNTTPSRALVINWTSDATGAVTDACSKEITGMIMGVQFVPESDVTHLYDMTLNDTEDMDVLFGVGANQYGAANLDNTGRLRTPQNADSQNVMLYQTKVDPAISNAGNAKSGKIFVFLY